MLDYENSIIKMVIIYVAITLCLNYVLIESIFCAMLALFTR